MFSDKKSKNSSSVSGAPGANQNRINEGTLFSGDIESTGFFRIDGTIKGNIKTPSKVVIGKNGVVIGTLTCDNADIEGTFEGTLTVISLLTLRSSAIINGDVVAGKLAVETGAEMNATCKMGKSVKSLSAANGKSGKEEQIA